MPGENPRVPEEYPQIPPFNHIKIEWREMDDFIRQAEQNEADWAWLGAPPTPFMYWLFSYEESCREALSHSLALYLQKNCEVRFADGDTKIGILTLPEYPDSDDIVPGFKVLIWFLDRADSRITYPDIESGIDIRLMPDWWSSDIKRTVGDGVGNIL